MNLNKVINKISIWLTIIVIMAIIFVPTVYKVVKETQSKQALVNEKLIVEKAEKCIYDGLCKTNVVTLKMLYENGYILDRIVNPYDKTIYNEDSYVIVAKEGSTFYLA